MSSIYHFKMLELEKVNFKSVTRVTLWTEILSKIAEDASSLLHSEEV